MNIVKKHLVTLSTAALLAACGGGGGGGGAESSSETNNGAEVLTGTFVDSAVAGIRYSTPTQQGLTNTSGEFNYLPGEQVTFSLGNTTLGVARGQEVVTPFTLFGISPLNKEAKISQAFNQANVSSFERALNVAMLLQNLDADGNPDNGIDLQDADQLLQDESINLNIKSRDFIDQVAMRSAKRKMAVDHSRDLLASAKHLYENLDVVIESDKVSRFNSILDSSNTQSVSFEYDEDGRVSAERTDINSDGEADIVKSFTYDDEGNRTGSLNSKTGVTETMEYDGNGRLISRLKTFDAGSNLETYNYNNNGKVSRFELDRGNDGSVDTSTRYTYEAGNLVSYSIDKDGDGNPDAIASYVYENGRVATFTEDRDNNGIADLIIAYTYDENGNRQSFNISISSEGFPGPPGRFTYDQYDNVIGYELDKDLDGDYEYVEAYTYNSRGQRTSYSRDTDGDGNWNNIVQYTYDENGNRVLMAEDSDGNGIADKVWSGNYQPQVLENAWEVILEQQS